MLPCHPAPRPARTHPQSPAPLNPPDHTKRPGARERSTEPKEEARGHRKREYQLTRRAAHQREAHSVDHGIHQHSIPPQRGTGLPPRPQQLLLVGGGQHVAHLQCEGWEGGRVRVGRGEQGAWRPKLCASAARGGGAAGAPTCPHGTTAQGEGGSPAQQVRAGVAWAEATPAQPRQPPARVVHDLSCLRLPSPPSPGQARGAGTTGAARVVHGSSRTGQKRWHDWRRRLTTVCASTPLMKMGTGRRPCASKHSTSWPTSARRGVGGTGWGK